jgi:hypothetical protein
MGCKKVFFFEKKNQKTFFILGHGLWQRRRPKEANVCPWPPKNPVMPAKAGMTGEGTGGGRNSFIQVFNLTKYECR